MSNPLFPRNDTHDWKLNVIRRPKHSCFTEKQVMSKSVEVKKSLQIACEHSYYQKLVNRTLLYKVTLLKYLNLKLDRKDKIPKWGSDGCEAFWSCNIQTVSPHSSGGLSELLHVTQVSRFLPRVRHSINDNSFLSLP